MSKYDFDLDMNTDNSCSIMLRMVEKSSTVLEIGSAHGRMTKYLAEVLGCKVDIIEIDVEAGLEASKYARVKCLGEKEGDVEKEYWEDKLSGKSYDFILFADVLEHLHNPEDVLRRVKKYLSSNGTIILSVPNVGHNAVLMGLLDNHFQYREVGLLDNTHIHLFTYNSLKEMVKQCGYVSEFETATYSKAEETELGGSFHELSLDIRKHLKSRAYGNIYQFIFKIRPDEGVDKEVVTLEPTLGREYYNLKCVYRVVGNPEEKYVIHHVNQGANHFLIDVDEENKIEEIRIFPIESNCIISNFVVDEFINCKRNIACTALNGFAIGNSLVFEKEGPIIQVTDFENDGKAKLSIYFDLDCYESVYVTGLAEMIALDRKATELWQNSIKTGYEEERAVLGKKIQALQEEKDRLVKEYEAQKKENEEEMKKLTDEIESMLLSQKEEKSAIIGIYEKNVLKLEKKCEELEKERKELLYGQVQYAKEKEALTLQVEILKEQSKVNKSLQTEVEMHKTDQKKMSEEISALKAERDELLGEKRKSEELRSSYDYTINRYANKISELEETIGIIYNSNSWKLTKGYRKVGEFIRKIRGGQDKDYFAAAVTPDTVQIPVTEGEVVLDRSIEDREWNKSIAVHVHLFYVDLADEFCRYLNNIPFKFDLYVSCKDSGDIKRIKRKMKSIKHVNKVVVKETMNRGRDIAPFYALFGKELSNYDYLLHVHSKKSLYTGAEQKGWRQYCLDHLLGSESLVRRIFALMEGEKNVGLFFPETNSDLPFWANEWLGNRYKGRELLNQMGIQFESGLFNYPVGSFFWVKKEVIHQLFDMDFSYEDFDEECGQADGTLAHALERVIAFVVKHNGSHLGIYDLKKNVVSLDCSYKQYQGYFGLTSDAVQYHLSQYDLVTFDIFDTLITRCVLQPDDVFEIIRRKIKKNFAIDINFLEVRKKAEALANETKGARTTIQDIYKELPRVAKNINSKIAKKIMEIEIETELEVCIPRRDMLKVFNHIRLNNKRIILISDMYLTSDIISKMLKKCGYEGYEALIVSCEVGMRKDYGNLWDDFFARFGHLRTVHVGDNVRSDIQMVVDRGRETFYIMNPVDSFRLSKAYGELKAYMDDSLENSIMLGLIINGELYNSPFSMRENGEPKLMSSEAAGSVGLGAIFVTFLEWLSESHSKNTEYWFLAREGHLFCELYGKYLEKAKKDAQFKYFLTSRRSASVAAVRTMEDVRDILYQWYRGGVTNLLKARLGFEAEDINDIWVEMPRDLDMVMNRIEPYKQQILSKAEDERTAYIKYIESVRKKGYRIELVDVGYSGTIQFFLMKLLQQNLTGKYMSTQYIKKPEAIGGTVESLYDNHSLEEQENSPIFKNQLLLEVVLQAPHGQMVNFDLENGKAIPVMKEHNGIPENVLDFQNGLLNYVEKCTELIYSCEENPKYNKNLAETILDSFMKYEWINDELIVDLRVEDDYCSNGVLKFNSQTGGWGVN